VSATSSLYVFKNQDTLFPADFFTLKTLSKLSPKSANNAHVPKSTVCFFHISISFFFHLINIAIVHNSSQVQIADTHLKLDRQRPLEASLAAQLWLLYSIRLIDGADAPELLPPQDFSR
jgi:hypothetical protein